MAVEGAPEDRARPGIDDAKEDDLAALDRHLERPARRASIDQEEGIAGRRDYPRRGVRSAMPRRFEVALVEVGGRGPLPGAVDPVVEHQNVLAVVAQRLMGRIEDQRAVGA